MRTASHSNSGTTMKIEFWMALVAVGCVLFFANYNRERASGSTIEKTHIVWEKDQSRLMPENCETVFIAGCEP